MIHLFTFDASWFKITRKLVHQYDHVTNFEMSDDEKMIEEDKKHAVVKEIKTINKDSNDQKSIGLFFMASIMMMICAVLYGTYNRHDLPLGKIGKRNGCFSIYFFGRSRE